MKTTTLIVCVLISSLMHAASGEMPVIEALNMGRDRLVEEKSYLNIKISQTSPDLPDLNFEAPIPSRICALKIAEKRLAMVVQISEDYLEYRDYILDGKAWSLERKIYLCTLNQFLAQYLRRVDIHGEGIVEVWFIDGKSSVSSTGKSGWNGAIVNRDFPKRVDEIVERFKIDPEGFVRLENQPHSSRIGRDAVPESSRKNVK